MMVPSEANGTLSRELLEEDWEESPRKRQRPNPNSGYVPAPLEAGMILDHDHPTITYKKTLSAASSAKLAPQTVAPFLAKHVPAQYAPLGTRDREATALEELADPNSKYCYRHRPDMLCRRQADEPSMEALQKVGQGPIEDSWEPIY